MISEGWQPKIAVLSLVRWPAGEVYSTPPDPIASGEVQHPPQELHPFGPSSLAHLVPGSMRNASYSSVKQALDKPNNRTELSVQIFVISECQ